MRTQSRGGGLFQRNTPNPKPDAIREVIYDGDQKNTELDIPAPHLPFIKAPSLAPSA